MLAVSLLVKIPIFLGFLLFVAAWSVALLFAFARFVTGLHSKSTARFLITNVLPLDLVGLIGLVGILGITALFFDLGLVALLVLGIGLGYVLTLVAWEVMGPLDRPFGSQLIWASARLAVSERFQKVNQIIGAVLFGGVLIGLSYVFFTTDVPSPEATRQTFRVFLGFIAISFVITALPQRYAQLASMNLDEEARTRLLLVQLGSLFGSALYISLLAWSFGIGDHSTGLPGSGVGATFSLAIVLIIAGFFVVTSLFPYVLGWRRARWWRRRLLQRQHANVDRVISILKAPGEADYGQHLGRLQGDLKAEYEELLASDPVVRLGVEWEAVVSPETIEPKHQILFESYQDAHDADPRFHHVAFLRRLHDEVGTIAEGLGRYKRKDHRRKEAESHLDYFADERARIDGLLTEETGRNWVWAGGSVVVLPVMGGILSKVGERVWEIVDKTPT